MARCSDSSREAVSPRILRGMESWCPRPNGTNRGQPYQNIAEVGGLKHSLTLSHSSRPTILKLTFWACGTNPSTLELTRAQALKITTPEVLISTDQEIISNDKETGLLPAPKLTDLYHIPSMSI